MGFETDALKTPFLRPDAELNEWGYTDPVSGITIVVQMKSDSSLREMKETVHNFRHAISATLDHRVTVQHVAMIKDLTSFQFFKERCFTILAEETFGGEGPDLGEANALCSNENQEAIKKILIMYKSTVDRAYKAAQEAKKDGL